MVFETAWGKALCRLFFHARQVEIRRANKADDTPALKNVHVNWFMLLYRRSLQLIYSGLCAYSFVLGGLVESAKCFCESALQHRAGVHRLVSAGNVCTLERLPRS